jgi:hypothetical protein
MRPALLAGFAGGLAGPIAPGLSILMPKASATARPARSSISSRVWGPLTKARRMLAASPSSRSGRAGSLESTATALSKPEAIRIEPPPQQGVAVEQVGGLTAHGCGASGRRGLDSQLSRSLGSMGSSSTFGWLSGPRLRNRPGMRWGRAAPGASAGPRACRPWPARWFHRHARHRSGATDGFWPDARSPLVLHPPAWLHLKLTGLV